MLSKIIHFVNKHQKEIILIIGVFLISLFSFAAGYIAREYYDKPAIRFEQL